MYLAAGQSPWWRRLLIAPFLILLSVGAGSCYRPDLNNAIYQCDGYACPSGLVCNSDKFCVYHPLEGCTNGGIPAPNNILLCPGATNGCASGYQVCVSVPPEVICQPPSAGQPDLGASSACRPCCPN
jgi:hypothetical protein